jgi:hypothetical protein
MCSIVIASPAKRSYGKTPRPSSSQTGESDMNSEWSCGDNPQIALVILPPQVVNDKGRYHSQSQWIPAARLAMLNAMAATFENLEEQIQIWIRKNVKATSRLEFKLRIELTTPAGKAEFIKDVIALANSGGEYPRDDTYLVIGFNDGQIQDVRQEHYDGGSFGQMLRYCWTPACPSSLFRTYSTTSTSPQHRFMISGGAR